jgi:hypothetical protein
MVELVLTAGLPTTGRFTELLVTVILGILIVGRVVTSISEILTTSLVVLSAGIVTEGGVTTRGLLLLIDGGVILGTLGTVTSGRVIISRTVGTVGTVSP